MEQILVVHECGTWKLRELYKGLLYDMTFRDELKLVSRHTVGPTTMTVTSHALSILMDAAHI